MKGHCPCQATGMSSHAIARAFGHCRIAGGRDYPYDPSDLLRCLDYCEELTITPERLREVMTPISPVWAALTAEWAALAALLAEEIAENTGKAPRTYRRMLQLRGVA